MKICFITASLVGGGAERVIANLSNEISARGHEVTILLTSEMIVEYELDSRINVFLVSNKTNGSIKGRVYRIMKLRQFFVEHKDMYYISLLTDTNIFVLLASIFTGIHLTISERNDPNRYHAKVLRDIVYLLAKKIVFQTKDAKACYSKRLQKNSVVIPNPVSNNLEEPYYGKRRKQIVAVGRLEPQKNYELLLEAFGKLVLEYSEYQLVIYGKGKLKEKLLRKIQEEHLEDRVIFKGFSTNIWREEKDSAMYVLSSDYEGMPNSLLEAMAVGMPVISTNCPIGGPAMVIESEVNGLLVPVGDKEELYNAMKTFVRDEDYADKLGKEAVKIREKLGIEKICDQWLDYLMDRI